jgi:phosphoribosylformylglycinamidine synthase
VTLAEACLSGPAAIGADIGIDSTSPAHVALFGEGPSRIVVSVPAEHEGRFARLMEKLGVTSRWIGRVGGDRLVIKTGGAPIVTLSLDDGRHAWRSGFARHVS